MCKQPIKIKNNSKYLNNQHGQPYYIWINCGHCSECRKMKQMEWNLRTFYESKQTIKEGGYIYFDTLTYSNTYLPRLTNYIESNENWACFDYRDIRAFYEKLRQDLKLQKDSNIRYFITSEYGELRHRPHYHIMLFVNEDIDYETLSKAVAKAWGKGRTDGLPYKSKLYVREHNVITNVNLDCIRYVAKYVSKQQTFTEIINKRWQQLERFYQISKYNKLQIKRIRKQYYRLTTPFHRQSQHFGESAMKNFNIDYLMNNPTMYYKDDSIKINAYAGLPMYFKRKYLQKQIKFNGKRIWINTEDGAKFKEAQESKIIEKIADRYKDAAITQGKIIDDETAQKLAHYTLLERGRLQGKEDYKAHHKEAEYFNYNTDKDLINLGKKVISKEFAGNDKVGYETTAIETIIIDDKVYLNTEYEKLINELITNTTNDKELVLLKEHLAEIKKVYFNG